MSRNEHALVVFSGGLDSTTLLYWARKEFSTVSALFCDYGSNHNAIEGRHAEATVSALKIPFHRMDLSFIGKHFRSALLGGTIPLGDYTQKNMAATVVPFRNGIFLATAAGLAESLGAQAVLLGNHAGDHFVYPDCRPAFVQSMDQAIQNGTNGKVRLLSPFCDMSKGEIVRLGLTLGVDYSKTYSCYQGGEKHCGKCGTCRERIQAFREAGVTDPTEYLP
ncbi:MAG: 7-cyano-7-deazaguanine synthase QueC [Lentisphaeria bacterium]|nr:7-cyano-7-deazaguanine synthase QueC [Lentisphaeria bacterium]